MKRTFLISLFLLLGASSILNAFSLIEVPGGARGGRPTGPAHPGGIPEGRPGGRPGGGGRPGRDGRGWGGISIGIGRPGYYPEDEFYPPPIRRRPPVIYEEPVVIRQVPERVIERPVAKPTRAIEPVRLKPVPEAPEIEPKKPKKPKKKPEKEVKPPELPKIPQLPEDVKPPKGIEKFKKFKGGEELAGMNKFLLDPWQAALLDAFFSYWAWPGFWGWTSPFNWWTINNYWFSPWWWWGCWWNPWWVNTINPVQIITYKEYIQTVPVKDRLSYEDYLLRRIEALEKAANDLIDGLVQQGKAIEALIERIEDLS